MKRIITDGNAITSKIATMFAEVAGIYPITPSTHMAEYFEEEASKGKRNIFGNKIKAQEMQSEAGAIAACHGALLAGKYASTFTSSQGLLLMIPEMYKIAGESLPMVMHVAARSVATHALSIYNDHSDIMAVRQTGFFIICSASVQECYWNAIKCHLMAINYNIPVLHFFDGFNTSHKLESIEVLEDDELEELVKFMIDEKAVSDFRRMSILKKPQTIGTNQREKYSPATFTRLSYWNKVRNAFNMLTDEFNAKLGVESPRGYTWIGTKSPKKLIVAMSSCCGTIEELIKLYPEVALVKITQFRPKVNFIYDCGELAEDTEIYVIDKTVEFGATAPLALDVKEMFLDQELFDIKGIHNIKSLSLGLSSDDISIECLVNLLELEEKELPEEYSVLINGKGSEGLVTATKWVAQVLHNQGYNVQALSTFSAYKSGGDTYSQLRVSRNKILIQSDVVNAKKVYNSEDFHPEIAANFGIPGKLSAIAAYIVINQFWSWLGFNHGKAVDDLTDIIRGTFKEEIAQKNIDAINKYIECGTVEVETWI